MSDLMKIALLGALMQLVTLYFQWRIAQKVEIVHKATNSMVDKLVNVTRSDALQEGKAVGKAEEKANPT